jgi:hypothetical protein
LTGPEEQNTYRRRTLSRIIRRVPGEIANRIYDNLSKVIPHSDETLAKDAEAVWSNLEPGPRSTRLGSHWLGHGWSDETWNEYGSAHLAMIQDAQRMSGRSTPLKTVMEWGTGGGANASAICPAVDRYIGVDISSVNLEEVDRQLQSRGLDNFQPILIPAVSPEDATPAIENSNKPAVDCFLSTAVYQHLPGREYARRVTKIARGLLAEDGIAVINIRYWDLKRQIRILRRSYTDNYAAFNKYTVNEFEIEMARAGFTVMEIRMEPLTHHAYFFLKKTA